MRVLLTTDTIGGVWTFTKELTAELLHLGHSVALVSFGRTPSQDQSAWCAAISVQYGNSFRYEPCAASLEWMSANKDAYRNGENLLRRVADIFYPDLLHSNQFCFGRLPISVPRLITAHSDVLSWSAACLPEGLKPSTWLIQYCALVEDGLAAADAVVAPTRWMLDALSKHFSLPGRRLVILNGRNCPEVLATRRRAIQAISAGRLWDKAKNFAMLADVHTAVPIFIAGDQTHQDARAPESIGNVVQLGALSEGDLLMLFRASKIYLATSIYEPFGLAPLEAALCGCAILANDIPSLREVWGDGAIYFKGAIALTQLLEQLQTSPARLLEAQQRAGHRAFQLSATRMTSEYLALYGELLLAKGQSNSKSAEASVIYAS